jgi:hypothetical protein
MMNRDCYFFVDTAVPEEKRTMSVICAESGKHPIPDGAWFYRGSVEGYGPFNYKCCICGDVIHAADQGTNDKEKAEATR